MTYAVLMVLALAALNLRGVRESGTWFAIPTYGFMVAILGTAAWGPTRMVFTSLQPAESAALEVVPSPTYEGATTNVALAFLRARALSSGCAALIGVEAISNGVPVTRLIQRYIVGVFVSFNFSQLGMVRHWTRHLRTETNPTQRRRIIESRLINALGLAMTAMVLVVALARRSS